MRSLRKNSKQKNTDMIKAFINHSQFEDNYEVWTPYYYRGVLGFIDLVVEDNNQISIFDFWRDADNIEDAVKQIKIETKFLAKEKSKKAGNIQANLVFEDEKSNRKNLIRERNLLESQPFSVLLFHSYEGNVESPFGLKKTIDRLFKVRKISFEDEALEYLVSKPNHEEIEEAIMNIENLPEKIDENFVRQVSQYMKKNKELPKNAMSVKEQARNWNSEELSKSFDSQKTPEWHEKAEKNKNQSY